MRLSRARSVLRSTRLSRAFVGLTWRWWFMFAIVCVVFALSRPNVRAALLSGAMPLAVVKAFAAAYALTLIKFAPVLLAGFAAANLAPRRPLAQCGWVGAAMLAGSAVGTAISLVAMPFLIRNPQLVAVITGGTASENAMRFIGLALADIIICAIAAAFAHHIARSRAAAASLRREQQQREEVERESAEARLSLMQAQIEPHFLFNSLASIRRLYETDPDRGRTMLRHLSRYLAASLPALRETRSTLGRETALAVAYLNVQKIRMGARLTVKVDVPSELHAMSLPPMMLPTLVENAILHGVGPLPKGGVVAISARLTRDKLRVEVADSGRGLHDTWGVGVGLANIRARLQSEFGAAARFDLQPRPRGGVVASLDLPAICPARAGA